MPGPSPALCTFPEELLQEARGTIHRRIVAVQTVQRYQLVLLLHEHPSLSSVEAAAEVGLSARQVQRWRSRWAAGDFSIEDHPGRGRKAAYSPLDQALIQAMACEVVAQTKLPLSRQSLADLVGRARVILDKKISRSTVWRMLHEAAIKPWQYEHWIFPRDPQFAEKAGPILDLYGGIWQGKPLGPKDYVLSMDEKTSIQARKRCHEEMPPEPEQTRRIETEYKRMGALQYLAAWDVRRGMVLGRCAAKTGIQPFGQLVDQVLETAPYDEANQLFFIVDNGSSHRGKASVERMRRRDKRIVLVHTPVHASWLNQVEIYFSIIQRKVLTPNDFATLEAVRVRLALYEELSNRTPKPFKWKFTRQDLLAWLKRALPHFLAGPTASCGSAE
jgi:transposase